jgi:hypothetical protein
MLLEAGIDLWFKAGGMSHEALVNGDWEHVVKRLGGVAALEQSAWETGAFRQARVIKRGRPVALLRLIFAYLAITV